MANKAMATLLGAVQKMQQSNSGAGNKDLFEDQFWKLEVDKAKNGSAVIRFLPGKTDDDVPFVKLYDHGFQGPSGKWYIEKCGTTVGQPCPLCEHNGNLWSQGTEKAKDEARKSKRRTSYIANVLIVTDPKHPELEGQVRLFKFGKKIFEKIVDKIQPQFEDESPVNVFDAKEGADFKLKSRQVDGWVSYDKSDFAAPEAIGNDKQIEKVLSQMCDLNEFMNPDNYKSYDELKTKLDKAMGVTGRVAPVSVDEQDDEKFVKAAVAPKKAAPAPADDGDDDLEYFRKLAADEE